MTLQKRRTHLTTLSGTDLRLGPRHPRANTAWPGDRMIACRAVWDALDADPDLHFPNAQDIEGFCMVFPAAEEADCIDEALYWNDA